MAELPDDVDEELWFWSEQCGGRDYLYDSHWHTHPGRMSVYCPHDAEHSGYRISKNELPAELPSATRAFVAGFLAGNLPPRPTEDGDPNGTTLAEWERAAERFASDGVWVVELDMDEPWRQTQRALVADATKLGQIGEALESQVELVAVVIPSDLAALAVAAARQADGVYGADLVQLAYEASAVLVHIGTVVDQSGEAFEGGVRVRLDPRFIGAALQAADTSWERFG